MAERLHELLLLFGPVARQADPPPMHWIGGGMESGIRVGLINYPRFPRPPAEIRARTADTANHLRLELCQYSFSIVMPDKTVWDSLREDA